jgi:hypothetical protein
MTEPTNPAGGSMRTRFKLILMTMMVVALGFGFMPLFLPGVTDFKFERLHVFLFNLVSGGSIILYFTENQKSPSPRVVLFFVLAFFYALFAFFHVYAQSIFLAFTLSGIVESVRIRRFSAFPVDFFRLSAPVSEKFHQASLLCLSIGLAMSGVVVLNNKFIHLFSLDKLTVDIFFLGFSFPLSLITMSVMFSLMKSELRTFVRIAKDVAFWNVNLGVIIFFIFILAGNAPAQVVVTTILTLTVLMIFYLFVRLGLQVQQKNFLVSGMAFLLLTAVTGILYIILEFYPLYEQNPELGRFLLRLHAIVSLYGWNLSGLAVICRYNDFPILLHSKGIITLHWITVMAAAPSGYYYRPFSILAVIAYAVFLGVVFFSKTSRVDLNKTLGDAGAGSA